MTCGISVAKEKGAGMTGMTSAVACMCKGRGQPYLMRSAAFVSSTAAPIIPLPDKQSGACSGSEWDRRVYEAHKRPVIDGFMSLAQEGVYHVYALGDNYYNTTAKKYSIMSRFESQVSVNETYTGRISYISSTHLDIPNTLVLRTYFGPQCKNYICFCIDILIYFIFNMVLYTWSPRAWHLSRSCTS